MPHCGPAQNSGPDTWLLALHSPASCHACPFMHTGSYLRGRCITASGGRTMMPHLQLESETLHSTNRLSTVPLITQGLCRSLRGQAGHMWSSSQPWAAWPWLTFQPRHQPHHSQHQPVAPHTPDPARRRHPHLRQTHPSSRAMVRLQAVQVVVVVYRKVLWGGTRGWEVQRGLWALTAWQSRCRVGFCPACGL